jgi:hypothetical protein
MVETAQCALRLDICNRNSPYGRHVSIRLDDRCRPGACAAMDPGRSLFAPDRGLACTAQASAVTSDQPAHHHLASLIGAAGDAIARET